ncbi:uncharacterized protein LOC124363834 [Homalodisca vitripennis]|uniref:uncharacterized protein LOC124363834 n=1 Tax=Homalodisca vitripennis TaxID=197043 RepID=UPI001EEA47B1|nr:uncharacterized protein LOC124363834 [Homalodisca vitripennis]
MKLLLASVLLLSLVIHEGVCQRCAFHKKCINCSTLQTCRNFMNTHIIQNVTCSYSAPYCDPSGLTCVRTPTMSCTTTTAKTTTAAAPAPAVESEETGQVVQ